MLVVTQGDCRGVLCVVLGRAGVLLDRLDTSRSATTHAASKAAGIKQNGGRLGVQLNQQPK